MEHYDALKGAQKDGNFRVGMEESGFLRVTDGVFFTRKETFELFGFKFSHELRGE